MLIGELAKSSGLTKASLRHYVELGLLTPTPKQAGQRAYNDFSDDDVKRLKWIKLGKTMGFSLKEIRPYLDLFMSGETPADGWGLYLDRSWRRSNKKSLSSRMYGPYC